MITEINSPLVLGFFFRIKNVLKEGENNLDRQDNEWQKNVENQNLPKQVRRVNFNLQFPANMDIFSHCANVLIDFK